MEKESKAAAGKSPAAPAGSELWEGPAGDFVARAPIYGDILARLGARDGVHGDPCDWPDTLPVWRVMGSSPIVAMIRATDPRRAAAIFAHRYGSKPHYVGRREVLGECADTGVPILAGDHLAWTPTDRISRCTLEAVKPDGASFPYGPSGPEPVGDAAEDNSPTMHAYCTATERLHCLSLEELEELLYTALIELGLRSPSGAPWSISSLQEAAERRRTTPPELDQIEWGNPARVAKLREAVEAGIALLATPAIPGDCDADLSARGEGA
jgi:hypothetical protein